MAGCNAGNLFSIEDSRSCRRLCISYEYNHGTHTMCDKSNVFSGCSGNLGKLFFPFSGTHLKLFRNEWPICLLGDFYRTNRRRLVSRQRYALLFIHENAWNFWKFCPTRTKLLYSLVSWSLLCVPETLPRQKQSWQSWYEWHFWHLYRKPVKFSLWHASHMTGWATEMSRMKNSFIRTCMHYVSSYENSKIENSVKAILYYTPRRNFNRFVSID